MLPFPSPQARQQAEMLMQPALIRVIDNIRKQLETSGWQGDYRETQLWSEGVSEGQIQQVKDLQAQLATAEPEATEAIQAALATLPQPFPGYELHLAQGDRQRVIDIWELCYCVCFERFPVAAGEAIAIDMRLIDAEFGDVDWLALDEKARGLVEILFQGDEDEDAGWC